MTWRIAAGPGHLTGWEDHRLAAHRHCPGKAVNKFELIVRRRRKGRGWVRVI